MSDEAVELSEDSSGGGNKLLTILAGAQLLMTIGIFAMFMLQMGPFAPPPEEADMEDMPPEPAIYESMDSPIVANFTHQGRERYLQLVAQFMTRSDEAVLSIRTHMPVIVDHIYRLLATYDFEVIQSLEGRERLRSEVLMKAQEVLEANTGLPGIEEVYFTTYVFQ
jgi:flagellar FliL protein